MTRTLGIDPGPLTSGAVVYSGCRVEWSARAAPLDGVLDLLAHGAYDLVAIERVQSAGIAGASLLTTSEIVGRLHQRALDCGHRVALVYRRDVLRALDVTGQGGRDAMVRDRLIQMHGGSKEAAVGTKKYPGPLYGLAGDAWAALGVAVAGACAAEALGGWPVPG